jgi:hypothetical protein
MLKKERRSRRKVLQWQKLRRSAEKQAIQDHGSFLIHL